MKRSDFFYHLPQELIAQTPLLEREQSRLLVFDRATEQVEHKIFCDILDFFREGDVLVANNTKVLPARLYAIKEQTQAKIEILLLKRVSLNVWQVLLKPQKRAKPDTLLVVSDRLSCKVLRHIDDGVSEVEFFYEGVLEDILHDVGQMPLPHYIKQQLEDKQRYQTVYSKHLGSAAAPTAGLHFTQPLLDRLKEKGVIWTEVLLHVGLGTFRPVKAEYLQEHKMHSEYYEMSKQTADIINLAKQEKRRVIAIGTTSVRVLESCAQKYSENGQNQEYYVTHSTGNTDIFIHPPYKFRIVDGLVTNFHLPESTLLMLVSAFVGQQKALEIYNLAVQQRYRFFSFGDAMLLL